MHIREINRLFEVHDLNNIGYIDTMYQGADKKKLILELEDVREEALIERSKTALHDTYIQLKGRWYDVVNRSFVLLSKTSIVHETASALLSDTEPYHNIKNINTLSRYYESFLKFVESNSIVAVYMHGGYKKQLEDIKENAVSATTFDDPPYECGLSKTYDFTCEMRKALSTCATKYEMDLEEVVRRYEGVVKAAISHVCTDIK